MAIALFAFGVTPSHVLKEFASNWGILRVTNAVFGVESS
jgi:hypothetical protein